MKFQVGQIVYLARDIRGWFNYSARDYMPAGTVGTITKIDPLDNIDKRYYVFFGKEFGEVLISELFLKLG